MRLEKFSHDDFDLALKWTFRSLTRSKTTSVNPKAILLSGQSDHTQRGRIIQPEGNLS